MTGVSVFVSSGEQEETAKEKAATCGSRISFFVTSAQQLTNSAF